MWKKMNRQSMKSTETNTERRKSQRRLQVERRTTFERAFSGERRDTDRRGFALAMVDALSDILRWEQRRSAAS